MKLPLPKLEALYAQFSKLSRRNKLLLYSAAIIVTLLLLEKLIVEPIYLNLKALDKEIAEKSKQIENDLMIISRKDRIQAETKTFVAFVTAPATEEEAATALLKEIEGLAGKSQVNLNDIKPAGVKADATSKRYMVTLTCDGAMEQITAFLYAIESSDKLLKVERYQISPKSRDSIAAQASLTVSQAVLPEKKEKEE
jgi:hypothetical protein